MQNLPFLMLKSLLKRGRAITDNTLAQCRAIEFSVDDYRVDYDHYARYEHLTGWRSEISHPCYLQTCMLTLQLKTLLHADAPFKALGLVHVHNHIVQHPQFALGQPFDIKSRFGRIMRHRKGVAFEVIITAEQKGIIVYQATGTYLDKSAQINTHDLLECEHLPLVEMDANAITRLLTGLVFASSIGREYASISNDYNPIHLFSLTARLFGFKQSIAHGMYSMAAAVAAEECSVQFKPQQSSVAVMCDFVKPVMLPAKTTLLTACSGQDRMLTLHEQGQPNTIHLHIRYQRGEAIRLTHR